MKNIIYILSIILLAVFFAGCEKESVVDNSVVYTEYTVVRAELSTKKLFEGVKITRTLPFDETYTIEKAEIQNAHAYLRINNVQVVPLHYIASGIYKPLVDLFIKAGTTYELFVELNGKNIYSKTRAPEIPEIRQAVFYNDKVIKVTVLPKLNEVYGSTWEIVDENSHKISSANDFFNLYQDAFANGVNPINTFTKEITELYRNDYYKPLTYAKLYAYDQAYGEYFKSKNNNQVIENIFAQGGGPVAWNVYGENTIGLFMGWAESQRMKVK